MSDSIYRDLMERFAEPGGRYPGMDVPEFYEMARELFSPEEAAVAAIMPRGFATAADLAKSLESSPEQVEGLLQGMASRGVCMSNSSQEPTTYVLPPFVPGIFELVFMRGTETERDKRLARAIHAYKEKVDEVRGIPQLTKPFARVIPVDERIDVRDTIHTFDQVSSYVENSNPISVCTCYCRHEAKLVDPEDECDKPFGVCMQFGPSARFIIEQGLGREIGKPEASKILRESEEAGLVHCSTNHQNISFICNCCADHCGILKLALAQAKPGRALNSGFRPIVEEDDCTGCEECADSCPPTALKMTEDDLPECDLDRCFGCGVCATICPTDAISLVEKPGRATPPAPPGAVASAL